MGYGVRVLKAASDGGDATDQGRRNGPESREEPGRTTKLTFDVLGGCEAVGYAVTNPGAVVPVTVTFTRDCTHPASGHRRARAVDTARVLLGDDFDSTEPAASPGSRILRRSF
jgi:hypothetical protein